MRMKRGDLVLLREPLAVPTGRGDCPSPDILLGNLPSVSCPLQFEAIFTPTIIVKLRDLSRIPGSSNENKAN